jgi:hypothetical protein
MPTPFPGMDPYLERASLWPNVHNSLIVALRDELAPRLRPRYYVAVEERTVRLEPEDLAFATRPDVAVVRPQRGVREQSLADEQTTGGVITVELPMADEVQELYLALHDTKTDAVITVIEILSPANKLHGEGRRQYEQKRLFGTLTHMVEIDLLRAGQPMAMRGYDGQGNYRILVSRSHRRPRAELIHFGIRQPIPRFSLPLQPGDDEPEVDLNQVLHTLYDRAGYDLRIDYRGEADPPLTGDDAVWANGLLREAKRR